MSEKEIIKDLIKQIKAGAKLTRRSIAKQYDITSWKAYKLLSIAEYLSEGMELVYTHTPDKPKEFRNEKQTYPYVKQVLFELAYKYFSPVLKGLPDFLCIIPKIPELKEGFYEVKFDGRQLSKEQKLLMAKLSLSFNVYVVNVDKTGVIEVYQYDKIHT